MSFTSQAVDGFQHSNLSFATSEEVKSYNAGLVQQGFFSEGDLSVAESDEPVNAAFDTNGKIVTNDNADEDAQSEADGENAAISMGDKSGNAGLAAAE